ncbi:MAG: integrase arm-type DNA-binding domain-containing protein [Acidobacteriota bacterium]|nr:integrase arm-type DNA-binding domain-containing protein [Acidobacteriota bacterium]
MIEVKNTTAPVQKTKPKGRHPHKALSAAFVRSAPAGRHCDGNGLYLFVQPSGARSWVQRLVIRGRRRDFGLGSVSLVTLAEAREKARANRKLAREGGDPLAERRRAWNMPSFAEAVRRVVEQKRPGWRNPRVAQDWMVSLGRYAFPHIGRLPVSEVTSADVIGILAPIWHEKPPTARKLRQRIRAVLEWAVAMEFRIDNPCDRVGSVLGTQDAVVRHMRALPHREVAPAVRRVRSSNAAPVSMLAFEFLVLTAARWGEVRWAEWSEIDPAQRTWTVPGTRMKSKREHRVPLCGRAKEILAETQTMDGGTARLVFTRRGGKPLAEGALRHLLRRNGIPAVPHGFRSSFRDWAAEETDHPREVVEAALAHVVKNKVEAAYRRTDLFERRRVLMEDWASYLAGGSRQLVSGRRR